MAETLNILVVDDEPGMRTGVQRVLSNYRPQVADVNDEVRFDVDQADSGEQALLRMQAQTPHILLLDHKLPGISGLEVLEQAIAAYPDMLTVMITAYASLEVAVSATKRGAYDFLAKPFTPDELKNTVRKAAGRILLAQQARRLAQEKRQVRFQFLSVLAHELKAPLNAVEGFLQILKDGIGGDDPAARQHMIERCVIRTAHMRKLIADLLDLTRIESGQKKRELAETDVVAVARLAIETAAPAAEERNIAIALHAPESLVMTADRGELEIILNNLISNAVKYNRDAGRVDVTLEADAESVTLKVADTGIGMAAEETARLFGEFVRIRNEKTRNILGSGLGLSIVQKLANLYAGQVAVESRPDVGSTFTVTLRRNAEEAAQA